MNTKVKAIIELTKERIIKYLNKAKFLNDFLRNMIRLSRFNIVPIAPIGNTKLRYRISINQVFPNLKRNNVF